MSPHEQNVSNFVHDLVQMAEATKELPQVKAENAHLRMAAQEDGARIARLETKLIDRANEIDELRAKLRSVEAERDDAGFRQLEAEDRLDALKRLVAGFQSDALAALKAMEPVVKPEPVVEGQSEVPPASATTQSFDLSPSSIGTPQAGPDLSVSSADATQIEAPKVAPVDPIAAPASQTTTGPEPSVSVSDPGQSEPLPTPVAASAPEPVPSTTATSQDGATSNAEPPKPFAGKIYYDFPGNYTLATWLAGGGTEEGFNWRPWSGVPRPYAA